MKILHLDIETSPNTAHVWGLWNQNVSIGQLRESSYTLCWAAKWDGVRGIMFDSLYYSSNKKMMKGLHDLLEEADVVVHYNGTKFDIPTINKEFLLLGLGPPSPYKQIDLLRTARQKFKFPSNKLDYVAQALGIGKKVTHVGHELWIKCMNNDPKAWKMMEKYNKGDVTLLEKLYECLLPWISNHPNYGLYSDLDRPVCTNCGSHNLHSRGYSRTKTQIYRRFHCTNCGTWNRSRFTEVDQELRNRILVQEV